MRVLRHTVLKAGNEFVLPSKIVHMVETNDENGYSLSIWYWVKE